jgi:hypothetical protein
MNVLLKAAAFFTAILIVGCASTPTPPTDWSSYDFGVAPANGYQPRIEDLMQASLKDPDSAQFKWGDPFKGYVQGSGINCCDVKWTGYAARFQVNAKNSYGGYTGFKPSIVIFDKDGSVYGLADGYGAAGSGMPNLYLPGESGGMGLIFSVEHVKPAI